MTKIHLAFPKIVLMVGLLVIATYTSGCSSQSLSTGVADTKSPHEDGGTSFKKTARIGPQSFYR